MSETRDWAGNIVAKVKLVVGAGAGWKAAEQFLRRRSSIAPIREHLSRSGLNVPDDDDAEPEVCPTCPYRDKDKDDAPESTDEAAAAKSAAKGATSWDATIDSVNASIAGGVTPSAAPIGGDQ